jgi:hypothetical protein
MPLGISVRKLRDIAVEFIETGVHRNTHRLIHHHSIVHLYALPTPEGWIMQENELILRSCADRSLSGALHYVQGNEEALAEV